MTANPDAPLRSKPPAREVMAEAAVWIARLHSPARTADTEARFQEWLASDPSHALAFEQATMVWDQTASVSTTNVLNARRGRVHNALEGAQQVATRRSRLRAPFLVAGAALTCCLLLIMAWVVQPTSEGPRVLTTAVGELRTVNLEDGSRVTLNTDTEVELPAWSSTREVRLKRGEALFEVAKDASRPFLVDASDQRVVAIGTSFLVRLLDDPLGDAPKKQVSVTLLEGKIGIAGPKESPFDVIQQRVRVAVLQPGQQTIVGANASGEIRDVPKLEATTAWRRGEVVLADTPLSVAVAEMNRYSATPIVIESSISPEQRVSGIFRAGDSEAFAVAVSNVHALKVVKGKNALTLSAR